MATENLALLGAIGTVCSILFAYIGFQRGMKKQCEEECLQNGEIKANISYIRAGVDDIKIDLKAQDVCKPCWISD